LKIQRSSTGFVWLFIGILEDTKAIAFSRRKEKISKD
jgi:hypothetical protein